MNHEYYEQEFESNSSDFRIIPGQSNQIFSLLGHSKEIRQGNNMRVIEEQDRRSRVPLASQEVVKQQRRPVIYNSLNPHKMEMRVEQLKQYRLQGGEGQEKQTRIVRDINFRQDEQLSFKRLSDPEIQTAHFLPYPQVVEQKMINVAPVQSPRLENGRVDHVKLVQVPVEEYQKFINHLPFCREKQQEIKRIEGELNNSRGRQRFLQDQNEMIREENRRLREKIGWLQRERAERGNAESMKERMRVEIQRYKQSALQQCALLMQRFRLESHQ